MMECDELLNLALKKKNKIGGVENIMETEIRETNESWEVILVIWE